jgi:DNA-directed RNA polymerase subunit K/omega
MSNGPNVPQAIEEAAGYVRDTIKHFTDDERKKVLDRALRELSSKLVVHDGS